MLDSSTGMEFGKERNEAELQKIEIVPKMLPGDVEAEMKTSVLMQKGLNKPINESFQQKVKPCIP